MKHFKLNECEFFGKNYEYTGKCSEKRFDFKFESRIERHIYFIRKLMLRKENAVRDQPNGNVAKSTLALRKNFNFTVTCVTNRNSNLKLLLT